MRMRHGEMRPALAASFLVLLLACSSQAGTIVMPTQGLCAHRGASGNYPENTLPAFEEAIRLGSAMIEFDVQSTEEGQLVILHDATVDRTTDGTGSINQKSFEEVRQLDAGSWKGEAFAGTQIPTLCETLSIMPQNIWLNVHVKPGDDDRALAVAEEIVNQGRTHQAFIACTDLGSLAAVKQAFPEVMTLRFLDMHNLPDPEELVGEYEFVQLYNGAAENITAQQVDPFLDAGINVNFFGTNDPEGLRILFEAGVQFPLVDQLGLMTEEAKKLGVMPVAPEPCTWVLLLGSMMFVLGKNWSGCHSVSRRDSSA